MSYCGTTEVTMLAQLAYTQLGFANNNQMGSYIAGTLIPAAQKFIDSYCNHRFGSYSGTWLQDGSGKKLLVMPTQYCPLISVTSITVDGVAVTADVKVYDNYVVYDDGVFTQDEQNVTVVASYGYTSVPTDVQYVCAELCASMLRQILRSRMMPDLIVPTLESGDISTTLLANPKVFTNELKDRLEVYKLQQVECYSVE